MSQQQQNTIYWAFDDTINKHAEQKQCLDTAASVKRISLQHFSHFIPQYGSEETSNTAESL